MRKLFIGIIALLLLAGMTACSQPDTDQSDPVRSNNTWTNIPVDNGSDTPAAGTVTLVARIMEVSGESFLAANMAKDANSADIYWIHVGETDVTGPSGSRLDSDALKAGMMVDIFYDGVVMESFPMQIGNMKSIQIREEGDDLAGLYMTVINDLYKVDPGLNDGIECMAFDFSGVSNLTEAEKTALVYRVGSFYKMEAIQGTFEELREQGYINKEELSFETGLLFTIEVSDVEADQFIFDANKWRGGDGAYYYSDCMAKKTNGSWTYTVGSHMIS